VCRVVCSVCDSNNTPPHDDGTRQHNFQKLTDAKLIESAGELSSESIVDSQQLAVNNQQYKRTSSYNISWWTASKSLDETCPSSQSIQRSTSSLYRHICLNMNSFN
jgi:hypothetical protein